MYLCLNILRNLSEIVTINIQGAVLLTLFNEQN